MPVVALRPKELRRGPFRGSSAIGAGLLTSAQLRSSGWRRLFRDVYVDATIPDSHLLRVKGAALRLPPGALITGRSAAHLWGAELAGALDPVEIMSPVGIGPAKGMLIHSGRVSPDEMRIHRAVPVCTPAHATWEIARSLPLLDAIGWVDALARRRRLTSADLITHAQRHWGERGSRQAGVALRLCDPRAESPPESRLRVGLTVGGLPAPVPQFTVLSRDEHFIARVDLAWPWWKFAIEYDGQWHADPTQLARDRRRIRELNAAGWYVYPVTSADMHDIARVVRDITAILGARVTP